MVLNFFCPVYFFMFFFLGQPDSPRIGQVRCNVRSATIKWTSSFNGGVSQTFTAIAILPHREASRSKAIYDEGENKIHYIELQNLKPLTKYAFFIVAQNKHGNSSSEEIECKTLEGW